MMSVRIPLPIAAAMVLAALLVTPAFGQFAEYEDIENIIERRDREAIMDLLSCYEAAFNERNIEWRMSLCLDTYMEYGYDDGYFLQVRDYEYTVYEVGRYWDSLRTLNYSIDEIEIQLDGPIAFVRAYTTHLAEGECHSSIVHFNLVKINGIWRIASDSYNIIRRY